MKISEAERCFVSRRRPLVNAWLVIGFLVPGMTTILGIWLFISNPLLVNPHRVFSRLDADSIDLPTLTLMAGMLPVMNLYCLMFVTVMVRFGFYLARNEKKDLTIIQRNLDHHES